MNWQELDAPSAAAVNDFLVRYVADRDAGSSYDLDHYLSLFPGLEEVITRKFQELEKPDGAVVPSRSLGRFKLIEELGRGGQGIVYLAEDLELHRRVAVKVITGVASLDAERLARFLREAQVASRLDHPGICPVHDAGMEGGVPFIVMSFLEGETLARKIALSRAAEGTATTVVDLSPIAKVPEGEGSDSSTTTSTAGRRERHAMEMVLILIEGVARALHVAHESGVVHRDIKPGNIMVTPEGDPIIMDFGLARDMDSDAASLTRTGDVFGTPAYMAPEQLSGQRIARDRRTDVYSLGATLFECLTLRRPFEAPTRDALYQAIMSDTPSDARSFNRAISRDLKVVLDTALEKDRDRRYATALALAEDLRRVRAREPIRAKPIGPLGRILRWTMRRPYRAASVLLIFVLVSAATWYVAKIPENRRMREMAQAQHAVEERERFEDLIQAGYSALGRWLPEEANERFEEALAIHPGDIEAVAGKALGFLRLGEPERAIATIDDRKSENGLPAGLVHVRAYILRKSSPLSRDSSGPLPEPQTSQDYFLIGQLDYSEKFWGGKQDQLRKALDNVTMAAALSGGRYLYHCLAAGIAGALKDTKATKKWIAVLEARWPDDPYTWFSIGFAKHWCWNAYEEAITAYEKAIEIDRDYFLAHINISVPLIQLGRLPEARHHLEQCVRINPGNTEAWAQLAYVETGLGDPDRALEICEERLPLAPSSRGRAGILLQKGIAHHALKQFEDALGAYRDALERSYEDFRMLVPQVLYRMGSSHEARGERKEALEAYTKATEADPGSFRGHGGMGRILRGMNRLEEALQAFERARDLRPELAFYWRELGLTHSEMENWLDAEKALRRAVDLKPDLSWNRLRLARIMVKRGDVDMARITMEKALEIAEDDPVALVNVAWFFVAPEWSDGIPSQWTPADFALALQFARRAVDLTERSSRSLHIRLDVLAWAQLRNGQHDEAVNTEMEAIELVDKSSYRRALEEFKAALTHQEQE